MSKSRLEKFLYALYSLDSSDLPTPLSRIEELYKCWVTGDEAPTFKPLSRVEKYLMAILGSYDVDSLPNPLSRVEVLLYKLATGDDNLDDVKSFLSEHEELLAEIIRNGGIGENIDIEYVLYTLLTEHNTLYNTAEKPVKSAILKGQTIKVYQDNLFDGIVEGGGLGINNGENDDRYPSRCRSVNFIKVKPNSTITFVRNLGTDGFHVVGYNENKEFVKGFANVMNANVLVGKINTTSDIYYIKFYDIMPTSESEFGVFQGDVEPTYELLSVKMPVLTTTGKNLFDISKEQKNITININNGDVDTKTNDRNTSDFIKVIPNTIYKCNVTMTRLAYYDKNKQFISLETSVSQPITIPTSCNFVKFSYNNALTNIQFEQGSIATSYKPFKTNILTVNEPIELRGIGDVKDELNLLTGELTSSLGEVVLDGTQKRMGIQVWGKYTKTRFELIGAKDTRSGLDDVTLMSDKLKPYGYWGEADKGEYFFTGNNYIDIVHSNEKDIAKWLKDNPTLIIYPLIESTIKTVDLSTVNQDGNDTKLSTVNDITYVTLSSEGLIPEAELEVATKNEEDLEDTSVYTVHTLSEGYNTLYNTAEKPVKSAILKGNTSYKVTQYSFLVGKYLNVSNGSLNVGTSYHFYCEDYFLIPKGTQITLRGNNNYKKICYYDVNKNFISGEGLSTELFTDFTTVIPSNAKYFRFNTSKTNITSLMDDYLKIYIDEDLYLSNEEYIQEQELISVKMPVLTTTGKNLFDGKLENGAIVSSTGVNTPSTDNVRSVGYIKVNPNASIVLSNDLNYNNNIIYEYDSNKDFIGRKETNPFTTSTNCQYIRFRSGVDQPNLDVKYQVEYGTQPTTYEPYKSNILTTPSDLELRGIGDVKDTLDLMTGELTQRVSGLECIDQNSKLSQSGTSNDTTLVVTIGMKSTSTSGKRGLVSSHELIKYAQLDKWFNSLSIIFKLPKANENFATLTAFKQFLTQNPFYYYRELEKEEISIKTVDLSVVDRDGNNTKLSTFDDLTHVTLSSEGLIPEAELEVAEKVTEVAASMLTISREQDVINTTTNEQSENVDATMIATTEIYEGLL